MAIPKKTVKAFEASLERARILAIRKAAKLRALELTVDIASAAMLLRHAVLCGESRAVPSNIQVLARHVLELAEYEKDLT